MSGLSQQIEMNKLKEDSPIPANLYLKYPVNMLAKSMVDRIYQLKEKRISGIYDYQNKSKIFLAFSSGHLKSILSTGSILNAHQTRHGATFNDDLKIRADLEDELIGLKLGTPGHYDLSNRLRPKYAYLVMEDFPEYPKTHFNPNYGNIIVKIKDRVKERTTFTIGDSMEEGRRTLHTFKYNGRIEISAPKEKIAYWEAQIWGDLNLDDIEYVLVNCQGFPKISKNNVRDLIMAKLDIRFCEISSSLQTVTPGKKITASEISSSHFLENEDIEKPKITQTKISFKNNKINIDFHVSDNVGLNFCQAKILKDNSIFFDDEISIREPNIKKKICHFEATNIQYPMNVILYAKDWYGNQETSVTTLKK
jgi:hypothetical protein